MYFWNLILNYSNKNILAWFYSACFHFQLSIFFSSTFCLQHKANIFMKGIYYRTLVIPSSFEDM